jgi:RNA polymerase sigma factor (sigma-70 family)
MTKTGATLHRLLHETSASGRATETDRDLLRRFAADGDQAAFGEVVRRHTGMVLGVCRRALPTSQDAEDACQATFLVLARKAGRGRWSESVAHWLFATARNVAHSARRNAERRARREKQAAVPVAVTPIDRLTGRELLTILDEELDRQPPIYRDPLVLYYLEELTREEIARRLGVPAGTVKIRLERGRKRLGAALTRRGVTLGAGLLALAATSPTGASPSRLIQGVWAAVEGKAPPAVAALAEGVAVKGIIKKTLLGVVLAAAAAVIGLGMGEPRTTTAGPPPEETMPARPAVKTEGTVGRTPPATTPKPIPVTGKVLDPDGKAVAGAKFAVIDDETGTPIPEVVSGPDGKFSLELPYPKGVRNPRPVIASAPGFGVAWVMEPRADAVFQLVPDQTITGKIIDLQGKPVAGATVAVQNIHAGPSGAFHELLKVWNQANDKRDEAAGKLDQTIWNRGGLGQAFHTKTAGDGTFALSGLGADRVVTLLVSGPDIADTFIDVATRKGFDPKDTPAPPKAMQKDMQRTKIRLYPPEVSLVVAPDKPVTGIVRDQATGKPMPGIRVMGASTSGDIGFGRLHFHAWPTPMTTTNKDGQFTLRGLTKARAYILVADPEEGTEYLHRFAYVDDTIGFDPVKTGFTLPRGVILSGRVTDAVTGAGVASRVFYRPLEINDQLGNFDGYGPPDFPAPWHHGRDTKTDMDGRYKITVMPGAGVVSFQAYGGSYDRAKSTQKEIDDGIVDKKFGHFRTIGQGGMYNPEFMHAYKIIQPATADRTSTLDVTYHPSEASKAK